MSLRWKSPVPKKSNKDVETVIKIMLIPPAIAVGLLALKKKRRKNERRKRDTRTNR